MAPETGVHDKDVQQESYADLGALYGEDDFKPHALHYGNDLRVVPAEKVAKSLTLLASAVFNSAFVLAEWIDRGLLQQLVPANSSVLELGAGTGLPSLRLLQYQRDMERSKGCSQKTDTSDLSIRKCIITDYPSAEIIEPLRSNVQSAIFRRSKEDSIGINEDQVDVRVQGLDWADTDDIQRIKALSGSSEDHQENTPSTPSPGFDLILAADLLWYLDSHDALLSTLSQLLKRSQSSRAILATGRYVKRKDLAVFFSKAEGSGFTYRELDIDEPLTRQSPWGKDFADVEDTVYPWRGRADIWWSTEDGQGKQVLSQETLAEMKNSVWAFELQWSTDTLS